MPREPQREGPAYQASLPGIEPPQPSEQSEPTEAERLRDIAMRAPMRSLTDLKGVEGIVSDGQFKTQHETGTSRGSYMPRYRKEWEETAFGPGDNPFYGFFSHGDTRDMLRSRESYADDPREDHVSDYGNTAFEFGEHMRRHTTYSWGDSLGSKPEEILQQGQVRPKELSAAYPGGPAFTHADSFFTEMHMHKRPHLDDVTQAIIYEHPDSNYEKPLIPKAVERTAKTQAVLMGGNIPHEVRAVGMGGQMVLPMEGEGLDRGWGDAVWQRVGDDQAGRRVSTKNGGPEASWLRPGEESARFAFEFPHDEERPMVSVRDRWRPSTKAKE